MKAEAGYIVESCVASAYFMRGAVPYDSMLLKCPAERERINDFIEKRLEQESKRPHPVY